MYFRNSVFGSTNSCNNLSTEMDSFLHIPGCNIFTFAFRINSCLKVIKKLSKLGGYFTTQERQTRKEQAKIQFVKDIVLIIDFLLNQDTTNVKTIYLFGHSFGGAVCHLILESLIDKAKKDYATNTNEDILEFNNKIMRIFKTLRIITCGSIYITSYAITNFDIPEPNYNALKSQSTKFHRYKIENSLDELENQEINIDLGKENPIQIATPLKNMK